MSGKVEGTVQDLDMSESSFDGGTGIGEVGASGKVWKLDVDVSAQRYTRVKEGFAGMLKIGYAFGKRQEKRNN